MDACALLVIVMQIWTCVVSVTFDETQAAHDQIVGFYSNSNKSLTSIIPLEDLSQPISVELTLCLYSVDGFDAVTGQVDITGSVYMEWKDETLATSIGNYDFSSLETGYSFTINPSAIWTPNIVLLNAVDSVKNVGDKSYKVRYLATDGRAKWQPRALIKASCKPNVKYYPFDRQDCSFIYTAWGYTTDELVLDTAQSDWYLCDYTANAVWALVQTSATGYTKNSQSYIQFNFTIERQPLFFLINILFPIVLLAFLDGFVFLLPAESGERVGFCVTCFLSFVFMLQTVLGILPQTAEPMSILCFYIVVMMVTSIAQCIVTIVMLRIYHKPPGSKVPRAVQRLVTVVTCVWVVPIWRRARGKIKKSDTSNGNEAAANVRDEENLRPISPGSIEVSTSSSASVSPRPLNVSPYQPLQPLQSHQPNQPSFKSTIGGAADSPTFHSPPPPFSQTANCGPVSPGASPPLPGSSQLDDGFQQSSARNSSSADGSEPGTRNNGNDVRDAQNEDKELKWPDVGRALDKFFFVAFTAFQIIFTFVYVVPMSNSSS